MDNTFSVSFYLYQLLSNEYKRSFVEFHINICDLFFKDKIIGKMVNEAYYRTPESQRPMKILDCPVLPGYYVFNDMKIGFIDIPESFPFPEGRVFGNITHEGRVVGSGQLDFVMKIIN
ncbi:uncharacterized protein LOC123663840 [Melitaea cinxia]|uniref:uncharacterized protein LOC123663840 n=1 Tax=Melitaea cinxia TaxID=113334 RepID=UPI001E26F2DC|nr:uncharacterized protein LOC123663840 [Melitaea cinxia]